MKNIRVFVVTLISVWLIGLLAGFAREVVTTTEGPVWIGLIARLVGYLSTAALVLVIIWGLWQWGREMVRKVIDWLNQPEEEAQPIPQEARPIE